MLHDFMEYNNIIFSSENFSIMRIFHLRPFLFDEQRTPDIL